MNFFKSICEGVAYAQGFRAWHKHGHWATCPYQSKTASEAWHKGYEAAQPRLKASEPESEVKEAEVIEVRR